MEERSKHSRREAIRLILAGTLSLSLTSLSNDQQKSKASEPILNYHLYLSSVAKDYPAPPIRGLCYSSYRDGQNPNWGPYPSEEEIREDLTILASCTETIRTYGSDHNIENIPRYIFELGLNMKVNAGCWLGTDTTVNNTLMNNLITEANTYSNVVSVNVGNETQQFGTLSENSLISYITSAKQNIRNGVSVTTGETWYQWATRPNLASSVDYILPHFFPYWEQPNPIPIEGAVSFIRDKYNLLKSLYPNKKIVVGEIGWPSAGEIRGGAIPSLENQRRFINELLTWSNQENINLYYFEAFDEAWKKQYEDEVGEHWGIYNSDRTLKHPGLTLLP